jgi:serine/threonine protein kinase
MSRRDGTEHRRSCCPIDDILQQVSAARTGFTVGLIAILVIVDVWSIGCILAELIAGKPIFKGKE